VLKGLDLSRTILANFDLCCADLQGSDLSDSDLSSAILSGANLLGCKLQGARVAGADLFRARIPAVHKHLLFASGMVETESVILE
jgi:uncharacterized protein YjbI with pentapeptide repeats